MRESLAQHFLPPASSNSSPFWGFLRIHCSQRDTYMILSKLRLLVQQPAGSRRGILPFCTPWADEQQNIPKQPCSAAEKSLQNTITQQSRAAAAGAQEAGAGGAPSPVVHKERLSPEQSQSQVGRVAL